VVDQNGAPVLQRGWTSRDMMAPLPPVVINGVVFAVSGGASRPSVLYALDGATGQELWNSGAAIASIARGLSGGSGQVYVGTNDGTLYAFGFPIEH
jgi:outer membrane protein assembly factor BamB